MTSQRDPWFGIPIWAKVVVVVGVLPSIIFFLLFMMAGIVPSPITTTNAAIERHVVNGEEQTRLLRVLCYRMSKTYSDARECDPPTSAGERRTQDGR